MAAFVSGRGDPHTFNAMPVDALTTIANDDFKTIAKLKLLLPLTIFNEDAPTQCPTCHVMSTKKMRGPSPAYPELDVFGDHALRCTMAVGGVRTKHWHDALVRTWFYIMRGTGAQCGTEVNGLVVGCNKRPDAVIFATPGSDEIWFDVRTCTPNNAGDCKRAATSPGHAAARGDSLKDDSWVGHATAQGARFVPLCFEAYGRLGEPAAAYVRSLANAAGSSVSEQSAFTRLALARLHISNMKGVARLLKQNAPIRSGPGLLPLQIAAPVRQPQGVPPSLTAQAPNNHAPVWRVLPAFTAATANRVATGPPAPALNALALHQQGVL